jgi:hypothetical protein
MTILDSGTRMHSGDELNALAAAPPVVTVTPLTATTVTMSQGDRLLFINPAGTIAALIVKLPPNPLAAQSVQLGFNQIVTALTVQDSAGNAVASTAGAVGVSQEWKFLGGAWTKWR